MFYRLICIIPLCSFLFKYSDLYKLTGTVIRNPNIGRLCLIKL